MAGDSGATPEINHQSFPYGIHYGVPQFFKRPALSGFMVGVMPETQQMFDYCGQQYNVSDVEVNYRSEHLFTLKQSLAAYKHYQRLLAECDSEIERFTRELNSKIDLAQKEPMPPADPCGQKRRKNQFYFEMSPEFNRIFGADLTAIPGRIPHNFRVLCGRCGIPRSPIRPVLLHLKFERGLYEFQSSSPLSPTCPRLNSVLCADTECGRHVVRTGDRMRSGT